MESAQVIPQKAVGSPRLEMTGIPHSSTLIRPPTGDAGLPLIQKETQTVDNGLCEFVLVPYIASFYLGLLDIVSRRPSLLTGLLSLSPAVIHSVLQ
jgi:hypothetical protein